MDDTERDERRDTGPEAPAGPDAGGESDVIAARSGGSAARGAAPRTPQPDETPAAPEDDHPEDESDMPAAEPEIGPTS